jgi:hypothetical protein
MGEVPTRHQERAERRSPSDSSSRWNEGTSSVKESILQGQDGDERMFGSQQTEGMSLNHPFTIIGQPAFQNALPAPTNSGRDDMNRHLNSPSL